MGPRSIVLAAGVGLAAVWLPSLPARAQGDEQGGRDHDRGRGRKDGDDRDRDERDRADRDQGVRDRGDHGHGDGDHGRDDRDLNDGDRNDRGHGSEGHGPQGMGAVPRVRSISPLAGAAGVEVTIRGHFPEGTSLFFGGVEVPATRRTGRSSITFLVPRVPPGPRAVTVRAGGSEVTAGEFRVEGLRPEPRPEPRPGAPVDSSPRKARWDRAGWVLLGEQLVQGKRDRDVVAVGHREGTFTRLMVVVEDGDLQMSSMEVVFGNGQRFNPLLRHFFREDDRTRAIDLPGDHRAIQRIEFRYGNVPGSDRARVQVWGRQGPSSAGPGSYGAPPPPPAVGADPYRHGAPPPPAAVGERSQRGAPLVLDFWPRQGATGTEVTIQGRRFTPDIQIQFGGQLVASSRSDDTVLTFVVPRHRGLVPIVLARPGRRDVPVGTFEVSGRDTTRERERWRDERRLAAERWWKQRQARLARSAAEREAALRAEEERLAREREERRRARRAALRARWEQRLLAQEDVRAELALHAEREARLDRMLRLAEVGEYGRLVIRIRVLVDQEDARHQQRMNDLKAAYARR